MEEGFLPHKKSIDITSDIDEERRLCYVGITRAQQRLVLLGARQRRKHGKLELREPSRFLAELPQHLLVSRQAGIPADGTEEQEEKSATSFFQQMQQLLG